VTVAQECGLWTGKDPVPSDGIAMEGPVFRNLEKEDLLKVAPRLTILAKSSPADKQMLVKTLQELGHVVAVTGVELSIVVCRDVYAYLRMFEYS
jgi:Ca2+-transporting ATPase